MKGLKKEMIILGVIIVILLAYLVMNKTDNVQYDIPKLDALTVDDIDKIEIKKPDSTITLVKKDSKWLLDPEGFPTAENKVTEITKTVTGLTLTDLVSRSRNYSRYHLHKEKAILVTVSKGGSAVREFEVGKAASTYGHTFVKIKDNDNVYHARESFRTQFDVKVDDIRDKNVMKLDQNEITEIDVEKEGTHYHFTKKVEAAPEPKGKDTPAPTKLPETISWSMADGQKGNQSNLDSLISQLTNLECQKYYDGKTKDDLKSETPVYTLTVKGSKDYVLSIYKKLEEGEGNSYYPAVSSENAYPFLLSGYKGDQLMKKPEDLIEKPETEEKKK
ncbi:MAG: DUF4340 domain-containing protein [bacterium]|nr:DUF4340 domain-containing protein [bacterium]